MHDTPHHAAVMLQVDGLTFEAKSDNVIEGDMDVFMGRGAFDCFVRQGREPDLTVFEDVDGRLTAALVYAAHVSLDLLSGAYGATGRIVVPSVGHPNDMPVLLSRFLLGRARVSAYSAIDHVLHN